MSSASPCRCSSVPGLVNFLLAEPLDGIMLMGFVVVVITISIYQEVPGC